MRGQWLGRHSHPRTKPKQEVGHPATTAPRVATIGWAQHPNHLKAARVFRRSNPEPESSTTTDKVGGKGRPTPTRKEAEAAARARAKVPRTRKEQMAAQRSARGDTSRKMREAMKTGDDALRTFLTDAGWAADTAHRELDLDGTGTTTVKQVRLHTAIG